MPWWAWIAIVLVAAYAVFRLSIVSFRKRIRGELLEFLEREAPGLRVLDVEERAVTLRLADGTEGTLHLDRAFDMVARLKATDEAGKEAIFRSLVGAIAESGELEGLEPDEAAGRLRARILTGSQAEELERTAGARLARRALGPRDLVAAAVLDAADSVRYLTEADVERLGLSAEEAVDVAVANLRDSLPRDAVRRALDGDVVVVDGGDTFDAARVLLVPGHLEAGERIVAVLPEGGGLILAAAPRDGSAIDAVGPRQRGRTVLVTTDGFLDV